MRYNDYPQFVRISQDTIVNIDDILEINKYVCSCDFDEWLHTYNSGMSSKIDKYFVDKKLDRSKMKKEELDNLINKLQDEYDPEIRKIIGPKPSLHSYRYYISLSNNSSLQISKRAFFELCDMFKLNPDKIIKDPEGINMFGDPGVDELSDMELQELYNNY